MEENKRKRYTKKEEDYIREYWGVYLTKTIAKNLGRSIRAIRIKALKLNLGPTIYNSGNYSNGDLAKIFGLSCQTIYTWMKKYKLPYTKFSHKENAKLYKNLVLHEKLMNWLEKNQDKFDSTKVKLYALGQEPDWLIEKRKKDLINPSQNIKRCQRKKTYTTLEIKSIWDMKYLLNKTNQEIANRYFISKDSVAYILKKEKKRREQIARESNEIKNSA